MTTVAATSVDRLDPATLGARGAALLQRDRWSHEQLREYQRARLRALVRHAVRRSPYYRDVLGARAEDADLADLPTLSKRVLMERFDEVVTDPRLRLAELEPFLGHADAGALHLGEYRVFSTSGTTGVPGLFVYSQEEFAHWVAVFIRSFARLGLTADTRIVGIGAPSALHLSQQVIAAMQAGRRDAPTVSVTTPMDEMVSALDRYQPEVIGGYPTVIALLAEEQLRGRLAIAPRVVLTSSEVLTDDAAARIESAWTTPVQGYFSTEVGVIAAGSLDHVGMHVCEEAIVEVVDGANRPVPPGHAREQGVAHESRQPHPAADPLRALGCRPAPGRGGPERPALRSDRANRRPERRGAHAARPRRWSGRRPPVPPSRSVRAAPRGRSSTRSSIGRTRSSFASSLRDSAPRTLPERVGAAVEHAVDGAGVRIPVRVEVVDAIAREAGHAAKAKLVVSEVAAA